MPQRKYSRKYLRKSSVNKTSKVPRKYVAKKQSEKSITRIVNKVIHKKTEVKHADKSVGKIELYHNNFATGFAYIQQLIGGNGISISQGVTEDRMVGNECNIIGTMFKLMFIVKSDRMNTKFRVLIVRHPNGYNVGGSYTNLFDNLTSNALVDNVDKKRVTVLYDKIHGYKNIVPNNSTDETTFFRTIIVPKQKYKLQYDDDALNTFNTPRFRDTIIVIAYDSFGTLLTDNIAAVVVNQRTYFTDM